MGTRTKLRLALLLVALFPLAVCYIAQANEQDVLSKVDSRAWDEYIHTSYTPGQKVRYAYAVSDTSYTTPEIAVTQTVEGVVSLVVTVDGHLNVESWLPPLESRDNTISGLLYEVASWVNRIQDGEMPPELSGYSVFGVEHITVADSTIGCLKIGWNSAQGSVVEWYASGLGLVKKQVEGNSASYQFRMLVTREFN